MRISWLMAILYLALVISTSHAQDAVPEKESPWLLVPSLSSDPKLGTSVGFMGGYIHQFDPDSTESLFILSTTYSNND